jgi:hypothetical protein
VRTRPVRLSVAACQAVMRWANMSKDERDIAKPGQVRT